MSYEIHVLTAADPLDDVAALLSSCFAENPFERLQGSTCDSLKPKFARLAHQAAASHLSLVAMETSTPGRVIACLLTYDLASLTGAEEGEDDAVSALSRKLSLEARDFPHLRPGHVIFLAYGATRADYTGSGVTTALMTRTLSLGFDKKFKFAFLEGFHPVTTHQFAKAGFRPYKTVDLAEFEHPLGSGIKVFAGLTEEIRPSSFLIDLEGLGFSKARL